MNRKTPRHLGTLAKEVLRFDRFYERRLREARTAMRVNEVNAAELGIFLELVGAPCTPHWLCWRLGLDAGYLSRSLRRLELDDFVKICESARDRRNRQVSLTDRGLRVARSLLQFQEGAVRQKLEELPARNRRRLVRSMETIIEILEQDSLTNFLQSVHSR